MRKIFVLLVSAFIIIAAASWMTSVHAQTSITVSDPTGDDRGPGYYGYPTNEVFQPGVFDMTGFEVQDTGDKVVFKVYFSNLGGNPWGGPNGFCLQYVHIYVHTTMGGTARMDTMGLNFALRSDYAWHFALLLAPGWEESPTPVGQRAALYFADGTVVVQDGNFTVYADPDNNAIVAEVARSLLPDVDNLASWRIVVAVASYDGFGPMRVRPVGPTGGEWVLNGTQYATPEQLQKVAKAIAAGIEPRVLDLAIYSDQYPDGVSAEDQYAWLDSYSPDLGALAIVPGFPPVTVTETVVETQTVTHTTTQTVTQATTQTMTETTTETVTHTTTQVRTETTTETTTVKATNWAAAGGLAVLGLIIGLAIGFAMKR